MPKQTRKSDRGFTLIELASVLVIVGIFAAISAPNLLGLFDRYRLNQATDTLVGAIKEAQMQAIRQGKLCRIIINSNNTLTGEPPGCLLSSRSIRGNIKIRNNIPGAVSNISFSHKGNTTKAGTIVLSSQGTNSQKCFAISLGTGIARTGIYTGEKTGSILGKKCKKKS